MARSSERVQELLAQKEAEQVANMELVQGLVARQLQLPPKEDEGL